MKLETLTRHLRSSDAPVCMLRIIYENICFPFELVYLNVEISLSIDIFFMSVRQVYTEFCAQVHRPKRQKAHPDLFRYFTKAQCFVFILSAHKRRVYSDSKDVLLLSV